MSLTPPNILWIITTQWRAQACGYAGDPNAHTPYLDALAAEAVNYAQAVTPHPFGPFARAALLTGVPSPRNGVRDYFDPLPAGFPTIAHALAQRGYRTAFFGKWHLGQRDPAAPLVGEAHAKTFVPPEARGGFEVWEGFESGFLLNDPWLHGRDGTRFEQHRGYQSDVVCARAAEWIAAQSAGEATGATAPAGKARTPWFAVVSLEAPHPPYGAPAAGIAPRDPGSIMLPANVPRGGDVEARARVELAGYYAHIEATDRAIGRLLLPAATPGETAVLFTSVHGDMHGAHGLFRKGWPHEESIRVPLLIRAPGVAARRDDGAVSLLGLAAVTVGLADGGSPAAGVDASTISMPSVVALPQQCDRTWRGVRTAERKLVLNADGSPWLFFDLTNDPGEERNLAHEASRHAEMAALAAQLSARENRATPLRFQNSGAGDA